MNESEIKQWLAERDVIRAKVIEIASKMHGSDIDQHDPTIWWPEEGETNVSVSWTEYGAYGSEWDQNESFPISYLWDPNWYEKHLAFRSEKTRIIVERKRKSEIERERVARERRLTQYRTLKEEFENEDV